ncbi:cerebellin-3-like [Mya arenaria]|uniref:cerebellin-3-like n=1 Tax=Mya arenaria TaxID=6604 RepID=UPI0022E358EE|nr:cerebellin-3-like [Mya arenaria]
MWRLCLLLSAIQFARTGAFLDDISPECACGTAILDIKNELMAIRGDMTQTALVSELQANLTTLQQTVNHLSSVVHHPHTVAFTAQLSHNIANIGQGQHVIFDHVITNVGQGYSSNTGTFTAPYTGTYIFYLTITSHDIHTASFRLMKNGHRLLNVVSTPTKVTHHNSTGSIPETNTHVVTASLHKGDEVWTENMGSFDSHEGLGGNLLTSFSGHILQPQISN